MDLKLLFDKSQQFEKEEARADVYPMVRNWIESHSESDVERTRGLATLLFVWNAGYYSRAGRGFPAAVKSVEALFKNRSFQGLFSAAKGFEIVSTDLLPSRKIIVDLYDCTDSHEGIGPTATSKILHLLQPDFFVMWDKKIYTHFHIDHRKRGLWHRRGGGECYFEFLREMQTEARQLTNQMTKEQIEARLTEMANYHKTLAKGLDEANYMLHTVPSRESSKRQKG